jgi:hypothetical protein
MPFRSTRRNSNQRSDHQVLGKGVEPSSSPQKPFPTPTPSFPTSQTPFPTYTPPFSDSSCAQAFRSVTDDSSCSCGCWRAEKLFRSVVCDSITNRAVRGRSSRSGPSSATQSTPFLAPTPPFTTPPVPFLTPSRRGSVSPSSESLT